MVRGDLGRPETLDAALEGIGEVFLLSGGPEGPRHDTNLIEAARRAQVQHVVTLSVLGAGYGADDPITRWHLAGERAVVDSGLAWTILRPGAFMSNASVWVPTIRAQATVYAPFTGARTAAVDPADIAAVTARALTGAGHEGRTYPLTGPQPLNAADQVDTLAAVLGRPLHLVEIPPQAAETAMVKSAMPTELAAAVIASMAQAGTDHAMAVSPSVEEVTGRPPRSFADWVDAHLELFT